MLVGEADGLADALDDGDSVPVALGVGDGLVNRVPLGAGTAMVGAPAFSTGADTARTPNTTATSATTAPTINAMRPQLEHASLHPRIAPSPTHPMRPHRPVRVATPGAAPMPPDPPTRRMTTRPARVASAPPRVAVQAACCGENASISWPATADPAATPPRPRSTAR